jgi:uncharacterized UBP type Zn finger protein
LARTGQARFSAPIPEVRMEDECSHIDQVRITESNVKVCQDCVKTGDTWVHLRLCMICGHVGCCDQSKNWHATKHFRASTHPLIRSIEPGETWAWCFVDELELILTENEQN